MISIRVEGLAGVQSMLADLAANQLPFVLSKASNDLAFMVRKAEMETVVRVFDRPKPQTQKNFFVRKGSKRNPTATIWFDQIYDRGFKEYMVPQVEGGGRRLKRSEKLLGRYYVPGRGAKLDRYGNMQGGQVTQVLSQLRQLGGVAGYSMNETERSKGRRRGVAKKTEYFVVRNQTGGLVPGVYQRIQSGSGFGAQTSRALPAGAWQRGRSSGKFSSVIRGRGVVPIMIFTRQPHYRKRFPFYDVARQVVDQNYLKVMGDAIAFAIRTAR